MKKVIRALLMSMLAISFTGWAGVKSSEKSAYHKISPQEGKQMLEKEKDITLIDVRTPEEFNAGHIKNAILIPDYELDTKIASVVKDKSKKIITYCRSGMRSRTSARKLVEMGYENVNDMGGIMSWPFEIVED